MTEDCVFCKIIAGEIPMARIYEDDKCIVVPDKFPGTKGQSLVIIKEHIPYLLDLSDELYSHAFLIVKKIGKATDKALKPKRTCILVEGFDINHVHIRIHPVYNNGLIRNGPEISSEELKDISGNIKEKL